MDRSAQIVLLRHEHQAAIDKFDFDRAENISIQIKKLESDKSLLTQRNISEGMINESFLRKTHEIKVDNTKIRSDIQEKYRALLKDKQAQHTDELTELDLQYSQAIGKETKRPVHEAESKKKQAKQFGAAHEYELAKKIYNEAQLIEGEERAKRMKKIQEIYNKQRMLLLKRQETEIKRIAEKQKAALEELSLKTARQEEIVLKTRRVMQLSARRRESSTPSTSGSTTPRRSASVSRSTSISRVSIKNDRK